MRTSGLLVAALSAALVQAGPAGEDVPQFVAADDAACASCDGQAVELLQSDASVARAGRDARGSTNAMQQFRRRSKRANGTFDCNAHPRFCAEPFNCNGTDAEDWDRAYARGATTDAPNFESWCGSPEYEDYMSQCIVDRDLVRAGHTYHDQSEEGLYGPLSFEFDASYCFIEGQCLNTAVTNDTTVDEANHMCDQRFGDQWRTMGDPANPNAVAQAGNLTEFFAAYDGSSTGFTSRDQTTAFVMVACMMGNYHCDIMFCKTTHCQHQEMIDRYGHFLKDFGWEENTEPWFVGAQ